MASSLKSRLARLRERRETPGPARASAAPRPAPAFLSTWDQVDEFLFARRLLFPFHLPMEFDALPFVAPLDGERKGRGREPLPVRADGLRFFDFETTGLSGGAGTVSFLSALGRIEDGNLSVEQHFLSDYPGEPAFVKSFIEGLGEAPVLVSYNGRSFDWPLFRSRCVMCGVREPVAALHVDLLKTTRRLWRRILGSVALGDIEGPLLGKNRADDIPGSEIPSAFFAFLEDGDDDRLGLVASHNAEDVASLAGLLAKCIGLFGDPLDGAGAGEIDLRNLGRLLRSCGRIAEGEELLWRAARGGDIAAALALARRFRREGRAAEAGRAIALAGDGYEACLESSRIAERLQGDVVAALSAAQAAAGKARDETRRNRAFVRARRLSLRIAGASRERPGHTRSGSPGAGNP